MRILHIPDITVPASEAAAIPAAPALEPERVVALENVAKSVLEKIQALEERVRILEQTPMTRTPTPAPGQVATGDQYGQPLHPQGVRAPTPVPKPEPSRIPLSAINVDAEAVNKNLMEKMWKYLNDEQLPKAI